MGIVIEIPERIAKLLREKAYAEGKLCEELVLSSLLEKLRIEDPDVRAEVYLELCEKYLTEAEKKLLEGDYVQASEKGWGAATEIVKAIAAKEGIELRSHRELHTYIAKLIERLRLENLRRLWAAANELHRNFYENWLPPELVKGYIEDVKQFVEILKKLLR